MPKKDAVKELQRTKKRKQLLIRSRMNLIRDFSNKAREKFGKYIKAVVVFGSFARGDFSLGSDTDVLVIIDDTESDKPITPELINKLHEQIQETATAIDKNIHTQLHILTEFWDYIRNGDALFFNYLRTGMPVYDSGFFKPMQRLLLSGAIKPSKEAVYKNIDGAKSYVAKVKDYMEWAVERLYRAVTWAANAYLMAANMPPAEVPELAPVLRKYFVETGQLEEEYAKTLEDIIAIYKSIEHHEFKDLTAEKVAELKKRTDDFVGRMEKAVNEFLGGRARADDLKDKIKTTPKIFWVYKGVDARGYAWLFEKAIFVAIYEGKALVEVLRSEIVEGKLTGFAQADSKVLFSSLETSDFKPIVTTGLIVIILDSLPEKYRKFVERAGVEFPNRALIDLTSVIVGPAAEGQQPAGGAAPPSEYPSVPPAPPAETPKA